MKKQKIAKKQSIRRGLNFKLLLGDPYPVIIILVEEQEKCCCINGIEVLIYRGKG